MDELDILKKDWNKSHIVHKKLSVNDIYPMLHKKSSSIVKTLLYISIAELIFWTLINLLPYLYSNEYKERLNTLYNNEYILTSITIIGYGVILLFIYLLYKSYKSISATDNAKILMENILKTRKIIKYYVLYNLIIAGMSLIIGLYYAIHNDPKLSGDFGNEKILTVFGIAIIATALFVLVLWLFYKLIYGLLLKRLNNNYNELKKLEI